MSSFPDNMGHELGGMTFEEVFLKKPKWIEFVDTRWKDDGFTTGLFLEFYQFVKCRLEDPMSRAEHEARCEEYVATLKKTDKLPSYLIKYANDANRTPEVPLGQL